MIRKIMLLSLVVIVVVVLVSPNGIDFFRSIPNTGEKITHELTDPTKETTDSLTNNIQKAFGYVGEKIEYLALSADVFLSKQEKNETTSKPLEEKVFFGKITGQKTTESKTSTTRTSSGGGGGSGNSQQKNNNGNINPTSTPIIIQNPPNTQPITSAIPCDTLSLITKKQSDNRVSMTYDDASGKTINVTVQIRNDEQALFTGQFFSSSFETTILDASATSHFIDLVVNHAVCGQVTATAFIPAGSIDTVIYGVFSKN